MPVGSERLDQRHRRRDVVQHVRRDRLRRLGQLGCRGREAIADGRQLQALRDRVVKVIFALEEMIERGEEAPRLRALNDPVIVGTGHGHHFAHAQLAQLVLGHGAELDRIADRADRDDAALARHESRHRRGGPEAAGIRELDGGAREVVRHQSIGPGLFHYAFVRGQEAGEVHGVRALDHRYHEASTAVLALHVHRETEAYTLRLDPVRRAIVHQEGVRHHRMALGRLHQGEGDEVGEGELLLAAGRLETGIQLAPAGLERRHREHPEGGGGRHREALVHVGDELRGRPLDRGGGRGQLAGQHMPCGCGGARQRLGRRGGSSVDRRLDVARGLDARCRPTIAVRLYTRHAAFEQPPPLHANRARVAQKLLVHCLGEPGVGGLEYVDVHEPRKDNGQSA